MISEIDFFQMILHSLENAPTHIIDIPEISESDIAEELARAAAEALSGKVTQYGNIINVAFDTGEEFTVSIARV